MSGIASAIMGGINQRMQNERQADQQEFSNDLASQRNQREQETHDVQMGIGREHLEDIQLKKEDLDAKGVQLKLEYMGSNPDGPPAVLTDKDWEVIKKTPSLAKYADDGNRKEYLDSVEMLHQHIPAALKGDKEAYGKVLEHFDPIIRDRLSLNGQRAYKDMRILPAQDGKFVIEAMFQKPKMEIGEGGIPEVVKDKDGKPVYETDEKGQPVYDDKPAPLTKDASSRADDPVNLYSIGEVMPKVLKSATMLKGLDRLMELERAAKGAPDAIKDIDTKRSATKTAAAFRTFGSERITPENAAEKAAKAYETAEDPSRAKDVTTYMEKVTDREEGRDLKRDTADQRIKESEERRADRKEEVKGRESIQREGLALRGELARGRNDDKKEKQATARRDKLINENLGKLASSPDWKDKEYAERRAEAERLADSTMGGKSTAPTESKADKEQKIAPLKEDFAGVKDSTLGVGGTDKDYKIESARKQGWTKEQIKAAAAGTPMADAVKKYDFNKPVKQERSVPAREKAKPKDKKNRPPLETFEKQT